MTLGKNQSEAMLALASEGPMSRPELVNAAHPFGRGSQSVTMLAARGYIMVTGRGNDSWCQLTRRGRVVLCEYLKGQDAKGKLLPYGKVLLSKLLEETTL